MCIKLGNELDTLRSLMFMSLNSIIADIFNLDIDEIDPDMHLQDELKMDSDMQHELNEAIAEYFDGLQIDLDSIGTLNELYEKVVENEFQDAVTSS